MTYTTGELDIDSGEPTAAPGCPPPFSVRM